MKIEELISPDHATVGLRAGDKDRVIRDMAGDAATSLGIEPDAIIQELLKREDLGSTGIGKGVAIPHARLAKLDRPFGVIGRLKRPIEFEAVDGRPVDLVVLVLLPAAVAGEQLNALACVARAMREDERLERLRRAKDGSELYRELVGT